MARRSLVTNDADIRIDDLAEFVAQAPFGYYRSSMDGRFLRVNRALVEMLGYDAEEDLLALDLHADVYANPDQRTDRMQRHRQQRQVTSAEVEWKRRDGHRIQVRLSGRPLCDANGEVIGWEMLAEDITQRLALERAVQQAQRIETVGRLTASIAHDFNNLLTVIQAHAGLIAAGLPPGDDELTREVEDLAAAAYRGGVLVKKLLSFSRRDAPKLEPVDVATWLRDTMGTLKRLVPSNIVVSAKTDPVGTVRADRGALEQILMNLATNARDAMPRGGSLVIDVVQTTLSEEDRPLHAWVEPGPYVCLAVSDNGVGMDEGTRQRIFEPLFTTKAKGEGTGLGMAVVYGLVKAMQGYVHAYSEPGHGTTVKIYLKRTGDQPRAAPRPSLESASATAPATILLVEDDPTLRSVAIRLFERAGHAVHAAPDGEAGLELFRRSSVDLVVTDLMMPGLDGAGLYDALRTESADAPILLMSGYAAPKIRTRLSRDERAGFVTKPWTAAELLGEVDRLLRGRARN